jgi:hypothetical protein
LLVAGWRAHKFETLSGFQYVYELIYLVIITLIGVGLWVMNMMHGQSKLQELGGSGYGWITVIFLYHFLAINLLVYFISRMI